MDNLPDPSTSSPPTNAPTEAKPVESKKSLLIVAGLLLLALFGGAGYYLMAGNQFNRLGPQTLVTPTPSPPPAGGSSPVPDETANWKTYSSSNFAFKYPMSWELLKSAPTELINQFDIANYPDTVYLKKQIGRLPAYVHVSKVGHGSGNLGDYSKQLSQRQIKAAGSQVAVSVVEWKSIPPLEKWNSYRVQFASLEDPSGKDSRYQILMLYPYPDYQDAERDFDAILSTFKFTDASQGVDTSGWKVYKDRQYGYEVNYPSMWVNDVCGINILFDKQMYDCGRDGVDYAYIVANKTNKSSISFNEESDETKQIKQKSALKIGGVDAIKIHVSKVKPSPGPDEYVRVKFIRRSVEFTFGLEDMDQESNFNQFLTTFKFTN